MLGIRTPLTAVVESSPSLLVFLTAERRSRSSSRFFFSRKRPEAVLLHFCFVRTAIVWMVWAALVSYRRTAIIATAWIVAAWLGLVLSRSRFAGRYRRDRDVDPWRHSIQPAFSSLRASRAICGQGPARQAFDMIRGSGCDRRRRPADAHARWRWCRRCEDRLTRLRRLLTALVFGGWC